MPQVMILVSVAHIFFFYHISFIPVTPQYGVYVCMCMHMHMHACVCVFKAIVLVHVK